MAGAIKITDAFNFRDKNRASKGLENLEDEIFSSLNGAGSCADRAGLIMAFGVFLFAQVVLLGAWYYMWSRIRKHRHQLEKQALYGHFFNSPASNGGPSFGANSSSSVSSLEQLTATGGHFGKLRPTVAPRYGGHLSAASNGCYEREF